MLSGRYKDEGGKDKCIELRVDLIDRYLTHFLICHLLVWLFDRVSFSSYYKYYGDDQTNRYHNKVPSKTRPVPIKIFLLYDSGQHVQTQSVLKITPDCKMHFGEDGSTLIRFRIEAISKNHQGQASGTVVCEVCGTD